MEMIYAIDTDRIEEISLESSPNKLVFNMVDQKIYATQTSNDPGNIIQFDIRQHHSRSHINIQSSSYGIEVYPNNGDLFITSAELRNSTFYVYVVSPSSFPALIQEIPLPDKPLNIAFNPANDKMYVTYPDGTNSKVSAINPVTYQVETTISLSNQTRSSSIAFNPSNGNMYVTNQGSNTVSVIDKDNQHKKDIRVGSTPVDVAFNPSNGNMYVTNQGSNTVSVIDSNKDEVISTITVGNHPSQIIFNPIDKNIYIFNQYADSVYVLDSLTNTVSKIIPINLSTQNVKDVIYDPINNKMYISTDSNSIFIVQLTPSLPDAVCPLENVQHWSSITFKITSPELAEIVKKQNIGGSVPVTVNTTFQYTLKTYPGSIYLPSEYITAKIFPEHKKYEDRINPEAYRDVFEKFIKIIDVDHSTICAEEYTGITRDDDDSSNNNNNINIDNTINKDNNVIKIK
jgi:YVTN family beta-propeller protein